MTYPLMADMRICKFSMVVPAEPSRITHLPSTVESMAIKIGMDLG